MRRSLNCPVVTMVVAALMMVGVSLGQSRGAAAEPASVPGAGSEASHRLIARSLRFEVVSIKPNPASDAGGRFDVTHDEFRATAVSVFALIEWAYDIKDSQIGGAPNWARSLTFDVDAKIDGSAASLNDLAPGELRQMVRPLLVDYFKLRLHFMSKSLPSYVLVVAKGGTRLKEYIPASHNGEKRAIRMRGRGQMVALGVPIDLLVHGLADQLDRPVVDGTGLTGNYDFVLTWTPDEGVGASPVGAGGGERGDSLATESEGVSIFTAVQEQLGLRLERASAPDDSVVIDQVERPIAN